MTPLDPLTVHLHHTGKRLPLGHKLPLLLQQLCNQVYLKLLQWLGFQITGNINLKPTWSCELILCYYDTSPTHFTASPCINIDKLFVLYAIFQRNVYGIIFASTHSGVCYVSGACVTERRVSLKITSKRFIIKYNFAIYIRGTLSNNCLCCWLTYRERNLDTPCGMKLSSL